MAQFEKTSLGINHWRLAIALDPDDYKSAFDKELRHYQSKVNLKGFRKGHAPMPMVRQLYGKHILYDVLSEVAAQELSKAMGEHTGNHVIEPVRLIEDFNTTKLDLATTYNRVVEYALLPPITEEMLRKVELEQLKYIPSDEVIESYYKKELNLFKKQIEVESIGSDDLIYAILLPYNSQEVDTLRVDDITDEKMSLTPLLLENMAEHCQQALLNGDRNKFYGPFCVYDLDTRVDVKTFNSYILRQPDLGDTRLENDQYLIGVHRILRFELEQPDTETLHHLYNDQVNSLEDVRTLIKKQFDEKLEPYFINVGYLDLIHQLSDLIDDRLPYTFFESAYADINNSAITLDNYILHKKRQVVENSLRTYLEPLFENNKDLIDRLSREFVAHYYDVFNNYDINTNIRRLNALVEQKSPEAESLNNKLVSYINLALLKDTLKINNKFITDAEEHKQSAYEAYRKVTSRYVDVMDSVSDGAVTHAD